MIEESFWLKMFPKTRLGKLERAADGLRRGWNIDMNLARELVDAALAVAREPYMRPCGHASAMASDFCSECRRSVMQMHAETQKERRHPRP